MTKRCQACGAPAREVAPEATRMSKAMDLWEQRFGGRVPTDVNVAYENLATRAGVPLVDVIEAAAQDRLELVVRRAMWTP